MHICYCYTPFRYAWYEQQSALGGGRPVLRPPLRRQLQAACADGTSRPASGVDALRRDLQARRANGSGTATAVKSAVIHPPVETHRFAPGEAGDALLVVSELVRAQARTPGARGGPAGTHADPRRRQRDRTAAVLAKAYPDAEFLGRVEDKRLAGALRRGGRAVVVPERGGVWHHRRRGPAAGRPVIAAAAGGALETVIDGQHRPARRARRRRGLPSRDRGARISSASTPARRSGTPSASRSRPSGAGSAHRSPPRSPRDVEPAQPSPGRAPGSRRSRRTEQRPTHRKLVGCAADDRPASAHSVAGGRAEREGIRRCAGGRAGAGRGARRPGPSHRHIPALRRQGASPPPARPHERDVRAGDQRVAL